MFKIACDLLPETLAKLCSKNKDYHAHDIRYFGGYKKIHLIVLESGILYVTK